LAKKTDKMASFALGVLPHLVVGGIFIGLIVLEPDLGTAVTLGLLLILMLFIAGAKLSHLVYLGLAALPVVAVAIMGAEYRLRRRMTFLDPWRDASTGGFQIIQSDIPFDSGPLLGPGIQR